MKQKLSVVSYYRNFMGKVPKNNVTDFKKYLLTRKMSNSIKKSVGSSLLADSNWSEELDKAIRRFRANRLGGELYKEYTLTFISSGCVLSVKAPTLLQLKDNKRKEIRRARAERKDLFQTQKETYTRHYGYVQRNLVGGVHVQPGFYSALYNRRLSRLVYDQKHPKTSEHHVGIELEFTAAANRDTLGMALFKAGLAEFVTLKGDGSIRVEKDNHYAHELAICTPQSKVEEVVATVTKVLGAHSASVNKSTGMHTHIDVRNRDRNKVFSRLVAAQGILYAMQPKSRRDNNYCKRTKSRDLYTARTSGRYQGVNPEAASKYNTIEVRLHAGTVSFDKIMNWVKLLIAIVDGDYIEPVRAPRSLSKFCEVYKIGNELRDYIKSRIDKFGATESLEEIEAA